MRVVHCKRERYTVFIGRGSVFGNPFTHLPLARTKATVQVKSIAEAIAAFDDWANERAWLNVEPERRREMRQAILDLSEEDVLGCYCKVRPDSPCHGDVIERMWRDTTEGGFSSIKCMAINADTLIKRLPLVDENILAEAALQPLRFVDSARFRVVAMKQRAQAAAELEYKRSRLGQIIRARGAEAGERITDKSCNERVEQHSQIREMRDKLDRALEVEEFARLIMEAYRMRRDAIRVIAETQIAEGVKETREIDHIDQRRKIHNAARRLEERRGRIEAPGNDEIDPYDPNIPDGDGLETA